MEVVSNLHAGRGRDVPQVLAGTMNAEILILLQAGIPLLSFASPPLPSLSFPPLLSTCRLQDGSLVFRFA